MFEMSEQMYKEYLVSVEGYPTKGQMMAKQEEEWELKEMLADVLGGFPDEYEIK